MTASHVGPGDSRRCLDELDDDCPDKSELPPRARSISGASRCDEVCLTQQEAAPLFAVIIILTDLAAY